MVRLSLTTIALVTMYASSITAVDQSSDCERTIRVAAQGDLDAIKGCKTFTGMIDISQIGATQLKLEGVEELVGDLTMSGNLDLQSFSAPDLAKVDGQIKIENHTVLSKAEFPKLVEAKSFTMAVLPALEIIDFPAGLSKVGAVRFQDTRAPRVNGFVPESIDSFTLLSNNYMKSFDFNSVKEVTGDITVLGNNHGMSFDASHLETLNKATFVNLNQVDMPALSEVRKDISFHENEFSSLKLDKLAHVGGTMTIANNNKLTDTSFKELTLITGALSIGNNSQMDTIQGFPALAEVHGTVDFAGSFNSYELPALQDVRGGMRLQTTSSQLGCSDIERKLKGDNIVKGNTWSCSASMQESNMAPTVGQNPAGTPNTNSAGSGNKDGKGDKGMDNAQSSGTKYLVHSSSVLALTAGLVYYFI